MRDSIKPVVTIRQSPAIAATVQKTNALVYDQGFTYNEAGKTYNEVGVAYGGLYGQDRMQMVATARQLLPSISFAGDFAGTIAPTPPPPGGNSGMLVGMLGMLYP